MYQQESARITDVQNPQQSFKTHAPPLLSSTVGNGGSRSGNTPLHSLRLRHIPAALHPPVSTMLSSSLPAPRSGIIQPSSQADTHARPVPQTGPSSLRIPAPCFREAWNKEQVQRGYFLPPLPQMLPMPNNIHPGTSWYTSPRLPLPPPPYYRSGPPVGQPQFPTNSHSNVAGSAVTQAHENQTGVNNRISHFPPWSNNPNRFGYGRTEPAPILSRNLHRNPQDGLSHSPSTVNQTETHGSSQSVILASTAQNYPPAVLGQASHLGDTAEIVSAASGLMSIRSCAVRKPVKRVRKRAPVRNKKANTSNNGIDTAAAAAVAPGLFSCGICPEKLKRKFDLKKHIEVVHWKLKKHKCPRPGCNARFGHKGTLTKHLNGFHDKKKPHKCRSPKCTMAFSEKGNLNKHIRSKHPNL